MAESEVNRVLRDLDISFDAALGNEDETAADELAYSLLQGLDLAGAIRRWGAAVLRMSDDTIAPIEEVGSDFLAAPGLLVPGSRAVVVRSEGVGPSYTATPLVARLRTLARAGRKAGVRVVGGAEFEGVLAHVRSDHIELVARSTSVLVPIALIDAIRIFGGD